MWGFAVHGMLRVENNCYANRVVILQKIFGQRKRNNTASKVALYYEPVADEVESRTKILINSPAVRLIILIAAVGVWY